MRAVPIMQALVRVGQGYTADLVGDHVAALGFQREGIRLALQHVTPRGLANSIEGAAGALATTAERESHVFAAQLLGAADALRRSSGGPMPAGERFDVDRAEQRCRAVLGDETFDVEFRHGATLDAPELAERVLSTA